MTKQERIFKSLIFKTINQYDNFMESNNYNYFRFFKISCKKIAEASGVNIELIQEAIANSGGINYKCGCDALRKNWS